MRKKVLLVLVMFISFAVSGTKLATATEGTTGKDDILTFSEEGFNLVVKPGEKTRIKLPVRTKGEYILDPVASIETIDADSPFTFSKPTMISEYNLPVLMLTNNVTANIEFEVNTKETAGIKSYPVNLVIRGTSSFTQEPIYTTLPFELVILEEKAPAQLTVRKVENDGFPIAKKSMLSLVIKNEGEVKARNTFINIDYGESGIIRDYSALDIKVGDLGPKEETRISLPVSVLPTATTGKNTLVANFTNKNIDGDEFKTSYDFTVNIQRNESVPIIDIESVNSNQTLKPGEEFDLTISLRNFGETTAEDIKVSIDRESDSNSFIKNYYTDGILAYDIKADAAKDIKMPLIVSRNAANGFNGLTLNIEYTDNMGLLYEESKIIYINVVAEKDESANVIISNVLQSPQSPVAGGRLEVSFDIENKSAIDLNEFKLELKNLTGNTFIPVKSDPYQHIGVLKAGSTKRITIPLTISDNIPEGLNNLTIAYSYTGGGDDVDIPIIGVQNDIGSASKPRLIVSKYEADIEDLRAGSVFNFDFEIRNTHSSVAAENIVITVSGKNPDSPGGQTEVFSSTQGSNSFFVGRIRAGETFSETLEMKVKSDAATSAYPIFITIEYEYDGIEPNPTTGDIGEKEKHELLLQVMENARPVVDYVQVYSWDGTVTVGNPATLYFEFYNMGKSMLNNVIATIEGDFTNASGNMFFMGNVNAGDRSYAEFEVIPNVEGMAYGVVKITYEDSNGDEQVYTKDFEASVMGEQVWSPDDMGGGDMDAFNPMIPEVKKAILPTWLFIVIQVAIFIIFIPTARKSIISIYKSRLRKKEEEMY